MYLVLASWRLFHPRGAGAIDHYLLECARCSGEAGDGYLTSDLITSRSPTSNGMSSQMTPVTATCAHC
jgi:hypothetical protein